MNTARNPVSYAGIGISRLTAAGALWNEKLMWAGLSGSMALFVYTVFVYKQLASFLGNRVIVGDHIPATKAPVFMV